MNGKVTLKGVEQLPPKLHDFCKELAHNSDSQDQQNDNVVSVGGLRMLPKRTIGSLHLPKLITNNDFKKLKKNFKFFLNKNESLTGLIVAQLSTPLGHCVVSKMSTPLNPLSFSNRICKLFTSS